MKWQLHSRMAIHHGDAVIAFAVSPAAAYANRMRGGRSFCVTGMPQPHTPHRSTKPPSHPFPSPLPAARSSLHLLSSHFCHTARGTLTLLSSRGSRRAVCALAAASGACPYVCPSKLHLHMRPHVQLPTGVPQQLALLPPLTPPPLATANLLHLTLQAAAGLATHAASAPAASAPAAAAPAAAAPPERV